MPGFDVVLFDFDGVIVNHGASEFAARCALQKKFFRWTPKARRELTPAKMVRMFELNDNDSNRQFIRGIIKKFAPYVDGRVRRYLFLLYVGRKVSFSEPAHVSLIPGVERTLKALHAGEVKVGIVSSSQTRRVKRLLRHFGLEDQVDLVVGRGPVRSAKLRLKPAPDPVIYALVQIKRRFGLKVDRRRVLFCGDLPIDVRTAKAAGVKSLAVLTGHGYREELLDLQPDYLLESVARLIDELPEFADLREARP
ncbi:MAG: phosphoglycolate phosphatase [Promethearchaeota archaeon]